MRTLSVWLRIPACLAIFLGALSVSCKPKTPDEKGDQTTAAGRLAAEPNAPSESDADNVAVTVNGVDITESDVQSLIKSQLDMITRQSAQLPPAMVQQYQKQLREQALEQLIRRKLLEQEITDANIVVTEEEVIGKIREIASDSPDLLSLEEVKKQLEQYGQDFDKVKEDVRTGLSRNRFMEMQWEGKINVTEEQARKYYEENPKRFEIPEQIRASHILIKFDDIASGGDPNEAKTQAKAKVEDLLKQIKEGADFAELAKAHSACPSAPAGGDLGFFPRGKTTPPFEKVAFELEVGQISDTVETEYGYHIIKVTDHNDASVVSFEQAKEGTMKQLTQKKQAEFVEEYINSLKARANIVFPFEM
ncbi:MAG: peptidylprolyl isomerase [Phycisphaerales bacterium]|nr:MAG: peptidylprolyl isomerase [Phycisphaerales bacterium]